MNKEIEEGEVIEDNEGSEEGEIIEEEEFMQPLANDELPIGLRGPLDGRPKEILEDDFQEDEIENFISQLTQEQIEEAYTEIMTIYQEDQETITEQIIHIQEAMADTVTLSTEILADSRTQLVPIEHMSESEMIRYVVSQIFEQFNAVNAQLTLLNNTGQAIQQTMEKTAENVEDIKETTERTEQTVEALAGGAIGIQATLNTLIDSLNEMKSNIGKFNPSSIMTNLMEGFSFMLASISKVIVFLYQTQLYYRRYCTTWSAPIIGPIANFLFTLLFLLIDATIVLGILELVVSQLKLAKLGSETEYILELAELYKKKIYKFVTELDVLKLLFKKLSKTFMILLKLLNLKDLYEVCMKQFFVGIESIRNATIVMMEQVVEVGVKGIKTAKVIAHTVQHGFSYAVSSARQGLAFTSAAAEKISDIKKQLSFGLAGVVSNILGYKPNTKALLTDGSTTQQLSQEEELQENLIKQAQEEGSKFFKKSVKNPSTNPPAQPATKSRLGTYFTPNDEVIVPLNSSYVLPNDSSKKIKKDIFGNKIGNTDDKTTYLTGEQFAETFTSKTGRNIKERMSSILEFERKKIKEIYDKTEQIIYNSYAFVSEVSSKGASNFFALIPSVSLQDVLSVVLKTPPKIHSAQEKSKTKSKRSKKSKSSTKSKRSKEEDFYTPNEMNLTDVNTTDVNTSGVNTTEFYTPKSSPELNFNADDMNYVKPLDEPNPADDMYFIQAPEDDNYFIQAPDKPNLSWSEAANQRSAVMSSKRGIDVAKIERDAKLKRDTENRLKVEHDAELLVAKQASKQKLSWKEAAAQRSAMASKKTEPYEDFVSKPKTGFFWGGAHAEIVGSYTILNNYDKILEPIILSFEIISLALLAQYKPSVSSLPNVIDFTNSFIIYQNITYKNVQKNLQQKYTRRNRKILISNKTVNKRTASKKRTAKRGIYNKPGSKKTTYMKPRSKKTYHKPRSKKTYNKLYRPKLNFVP